MSSNNKVWDGFIRLYHASQIILLGLLWYSAEQGDFERHFQYGYALIALIVARLIWGVIGSQTARFSQLALHHTKIKEYLRSKTKNHDYVSHNPLASYMVIALLLSLCLQLTTGLFSTDEVLYEGPLYSLIDDELALTLTTLHKQNFDWLLILIVVHVMAAIWHLFKGDNIIKTIITGRSDKPRQTAVFWRPSIIAISIWLVTFTVIFGLNV